MDRLRVRGRRSLDPGLVLGLGLGLGLGLVFRVRVRVRARPWVSVQG